MMFERILLPLDGSRIAEAAVPFALRMPSREVLLLHVDSEHDRLLPEVASPGRALVARSYLEAIANLFQRKGRRVDLAIECGEPAERIVDAARDTDLIVLATDGRGLGGKLVGGCTADRVARHAPAPTLLIRGNEHQPRDEGFSRVLVPLDGSAAAEAALRPACRLAAALSVPLQVVRVYEPGTSTAAETSAAGYLHDVSRRLESGMQAKLEALHGDPAATLMASAQPGDLIVLTTHGAGGMRRWFLGSVTERLIRRAACPVLIARETVPDTVPMPIAEASTQMWW